MIYNINRDILIKRLKKMSFSSLTHLDRFILVFCLIFYFVRPINYNEVQERKLARSEKYHIEVIKVSSQSISQSFYSNDEYKNMMSLLGR